jgi:hypothetical protein
MATTTPIADPDVAEAAKSSAIVGLAFAAEEVCDIAGRIESIDLAYPRSTKPGSKACAFDLEAELQGRLLLVRPTATLDSVILALTARKRLAPIFDHLSEEWLKSPCDGIDNALMSLAGWLLVELGRDAIATLPESLRSDAEDCLDNYETTEQPPQTA